MQERQREPVQVQRHPGVHRVFVGTKATAGAVALVRTSQSSFVRTLAAIQVSGAAASDCGGGATVPVFPTVGTVGVLKTGVLTTLRLDDPQANQTLQCDPDYAQGQEFTAFRYGCKPWYGANQWTSPWWTGATGAKHCPDGGQWFSNSDLGAGFGKNGSTNPWRCVLTAPGMSTGQVGDDIAVATENCNNINNNSCQTFHCNYDGNYDGKTGSTTPWTTNSDSRYPRVVNLFIVPYQGGKGLTGAGDTIPVLGFASFYVMNWTGSNNNQSDPCPDTTFDQDNNPLTPQITLPNPPAGAITGVFVETVDYEPGPVDPTADLPRRPAHTLPSHPRSVRRPVPGLAQAVGMLGQQHALTNEDLVQTSNGAETSRQSRVSADHGRRRDVPRRSAKRPGSLREWHAGSARSAHGAAMSAARRLRLRQRYAGEYPLQR